MKVIIGPYGKGNFHERKHLFLLTSDQIIIKEVIEKISESLTLELVKSCEHLGEYCLICRILEGHHVILDVPHTKTLDTQKFLETL